MKSLSLWNYIMTNKIKKNYCYGSNSVLLLLKKIELALWCSRLSCCMSLVSHMHSDSNSRCSISHPASC